METKKQKPFFAKFLEAQEKKNNPQQGRVEGTQEQMYEAYITKPSLDMAQTQKYPSDGDEI